MPPDISQISYIIGMPRAGTTSLYHNLGKHPGLAVPFRRKTNYFCLHWDKPREWFLAHFAGLQEGQVGIDTVTLHFADRDLPSLRRIKTANPDAKVMLFVRRPAEWAWSFYSQIATFDSKIPPFETFLRGDYAFDEDGFPVPFNLRDGDIEARIREANTLFKGNVLVADFSLFSADLPRLLGAVEDFLGLRPFFTADNIAAQKINARNRGNIVAVQRLLRSPALIRALGLMPKDFITTVRRGYDILTSRLRAPPRSGEPDLQDIADRYFPSDEAFVRDFFAAGPIVRG